METAVLAKYIRINQRKQINCMRRIIILLMCLTGALALSASCSKVEEAPVASEGNGRTVITATAEAIGGGAKAQNQYCYSVLWEKNDQIYVTDGKKANTFTVSDESAGTNKGRFTEDTPSYGITGDIEAFYPASLKTGDGYVWPAVQANNQAAPMYAKQTISGTGSEIVNFSSLGAMLQIVFNSTVEGINLKSIELKDAQKDLSGKFTVDESGRAVISSTDGRGVTLDLGEGKALGKGANFFYLAIPAGIYNDLTISFYTTDRRVCTMHSTTFPEVKSNTVCRLTLTGTNFKERHLSGPGLFSVGDGRVVKFAKGNLYWNGDSFEFEENQLNYPTVLNLSHIGHFFWSKDADVARAGTFDSSGSGEQDVLFTNATEPTPNPDFTVSGVTGEFRTLSELEWEYLLGNHEHKWVTICETTGIAIVPDGFAGSLANTYDTAAWAVAEAKGVVFLPSASYRSNGSIEGGEINGKYWSSAPWTSNSAQAIIWYESTKYCSCSDLLRSWGSSIRLVEDIKP